MNSDEYAYLHERGVDYVTVFQETYDSDRYEELHLSGHKRVFPYRFEAQERALMGGMRGVAFAAHVVQNILHGAGHVGVCFLLTCLQRL